MGLKYKKISGNQIFLQYLTKKVRKKFAGMKKSCIFASDLKRNSIYKLKTLR